jgi:hypothetical protein
MIGISVSVELEIFVLYIRVGSGTLHDAAEVTTLTYPFIQYLRFIQ